MKISAKYLTLLFASLFIMYSCDEDTVDYDEISLEVVDGFVRVLTPNVAFVAGTESYAIQILTVPGVADAAKVELYNQFTDSRTGAVSNEVLLGTYDINQSEASTSIEDMLTFEQLRAGIEIEGNLLPTNDIDIAIGSSWTLTARPIASDGSEASLSNAGNTINVSVLSPFAGDYLVTESAYYRIGIESSLTDWTGQVNFIGSVNDTVFSHPDFWGPFGYPGEFKFIVRSDNTVWIPKDGEAGIEQELFSGNYILNCESDPSSFENVSCAGSNVLEPSISRDHVFKLTYGYYTASGDENEGAREFYEKLVKIVE